MIFKSGAAFERLGGIRHLAFDKTGTLRQNQPSVTSRATVLGWAAALENHSTHPLAAAIVAVSSAAPAVRQPVTA